ncbi:MAG TPA: endonuclease/exonuclease/phosphatase family protein, partial [Myxococcales bacterium]|nr:endonuclease/exonuclease/phosphatase family protein [Myxococcales bacterium]
MSLHQNPLRVVSYNVRYFGHALRGLGGTGASQRGIARAIALLHPQPGIICLQEVETTSMRSTWAHRNRRDPNHTQLESFMAELEDAQREVGRPCVHEALYFRAHDYKVSERLSFYTTGLAILVDTRRVQIDTHNVEAPHDITHRYIARVRDRKQTRICAHLKVRDQLGHPLHVFNTHLSLPTPFSRAFWSQRDKMGFGANQLEEAKSLCAFIRKHAGEDPFIVCGDFNSPPTSPVYRHLVEEAGLTAAQAALGQASTLRGFPTAGFMRLRMHLDHLFSGGKVKWLDLQDTRPFGDAGGLFHGLSDHVPLL